MRKRRRKRVDWDEEVRKTERIRRRGLFISALGFGVAAIFVLGANHMTDGGIAISRKVIFTFCFVIAMFLIRGILGRKARLRQKREERELELELLKRQKENNEE